MPQTAIPTPDIETVSVAESPEPSPIPGRRRILLTGSAWALLQNIVRMAIGFISVPLTLGHVGSERYGLWMTALSINGLVTFLDVGLMPTLMNRMAEAHARGDRARFQHYASGGLALGGALLGLGLLVVFGAGQLNWSELLRITEPLARSEATAVMVAMIGLSFAQLALGCVDSIYSARLSMTKPRVWATLANVLSFVFLIVGVKLGLGLPMLAALFACYGVIYRIPLLAELIMREPHLLKPRWSEFPSLVRELVPVSVHFMGMQASFAALLALPNILIARVLSLSDVATFSVVLRVMAIPGFLIAALLPVFWPVFTGAWVRGERAWLRRYLLYIVLGAEAMILAFDIGILVFGDIFIAWWTKGSTTAGRPLLFALGVWLLIQTPIHWLSIFLHSITDFRFELICYVASVLLLVPLGVLLLTRIGLVGLPVAMALSLLIGSLVPMWLRVRYKLALKMT